MVGIVQGTVCSPATLREFHVHIIPVGVMGEALGFGEEIVLHL